MARKTDDYAIRELRAIRDLAHAIRVQADMTLLELIAQSRARVAAKQRTGN